MDDAQKKVVEIVAEKLEDPTITAESKLSDLGDSLTKLDIICAVEQAFDLPRTPDAVLQKMVTIQDIVSYVINPE